MRLKAVIHEAEEGGFWAEIPAIPGCCAQGDTRETLLENLREAAEGCLLCGCPVPNSDESDTADDSPTIEIDA